MLISRLVGRVEVRRPGWWKLAWPWALLTMTACSGALGPSQSGLNDWRRTAGAAVGTAHPTVLRAVDPQGRWVVLCQARQDTDHDGLTHVSFGHHGDPFGDQLAMYLVRGHGPGERIDTLIGSDPTGRFVLTVREQRFVLYDMRSGEQRDLSSLSAAQGQPPPYWRAAKFGPAGGKLALIPTGATGEITVLDLNSGKPRAVPVGPGVVAEATFSPGEQWLEVSKVIQDSDFSGEFELPQLVTTMSQDACRGSAMSASYFGSYAPDQTQTLYVPLSAKGAAREMEGFAGFLDPLVLRRDKDGALIGENAAGETQQLVPKQCSGTLHLASIKHQALVVSCGKRATVSVFSRGRRLDTGVVLSEWAHHFVDRGTEDLVAPFGHENDVVIDLARWQLHAVPAGLSVARLYGRQALLTAKQGSWLWDLDQNSLSKISDQPAEETRNSFAAGLRFALLGNELFDLEQSRVVGWFARSIGKDQWDGALSSDGRLLLPSTPAPRSREQTMQLRIRGALQIGYDDDDHDATAGPFYWLSASRSEQPPRAVEPKREAPAREPSQARLPTRTGAVACPIEHAEISVTEAPLPAYFTGPLPREGFFEQSENAAQYPPREYVRHRVCRNDPEMMERFWEVLSDPSNQMLSGYEAIVSSCERKCALAAEVIARAPANAANEIGWPVLAYCDDVRSRELFLNGSPEPSQFFTWFALQDWSQQVPVDAFRRALDATLAPLRQTDPNVTISKDNWDRIYFLGPVEQIPNVLVPVLVESLAPFKQPSAQERLARLYASAPEPELRALIHSPELLKKWGGSTPAPPHQRPDAEPDKPRLMLPSGVVSVPLSWSFRVWEGLDESVQQIPDATGSPLAGFIFDGPRRWRQDRVESLDWVAYGKGKRFSMSEGQLTQWLLSKQLDADRTHADVLLLRGLVAFLNSVARATGSEQRFMLLASRDETDTFTYEKKLPLAFGPRARLCQLVREGGLQPFDFSWR